MGSNAVGGRRANGTGVLSEARSLIVPGCVEGFRNPFLESADDSSGVRANR